MKGTIGNQEGLMPDANQTLAVCPRSLTVPPVNLRGTLFARQIANLTHWDLKDA